LAALGLPLWASFGLVGLLLVGSGVYLLRQAITTATTVLPRCYQNSRIHPDPARSILVQILDDIQDFAIFIMDADGHIKTWNAGAEGVFRFTEDDIVGQHFSCLFLAADVIKGVPQRELQRAAQTGRASDDRWLVRKDGGRIWVEGCLVALRGSASGGFGKIVRDQTSAKKAEEEIHQLNVQLQNTVDTLRTSQDALQEKINELEQFGDVVVGRELKMMAYEKERESLISENQRLRDGRKDTRH
jgi:PAS domain S-box-containing protein